MALAVPEEPELSDPGESRESADTQDETVHGDVAADTPAGDAGSAEGPPEEPVSGQLEPIDTEPDSGAPAALSEKPVLEWTAEDWARWIAEPPAVTRPAPASGFPAPSPAESAPDADASPAEPSHTAGASEEPGSDDDPTGVWSIALDQPEDDDARWWSSVAGLTEPPPAAPTPPDLDPPAAPAPPPLAPPVLTPIPPSPPPVPASRPTGGDIVPGSSPGTGRAAPDTVSIPRSAPSRAHALEVSDTAMRVRAGLSLLGVSVLVGAVAAGLITVAIFMAAVVLRRALG